MAKEQKVKATEAVTVYGTGNGNLKYGIPARLHPIAAAKLIDAGLATKEEPAAGSEPKKGGAKK